MYLRPCPICIAIALITSLPLSANGEVRGERPNVIFVMVDDMGYGDVGVYGQKHIRTPNVDSMARQGVRYTNVYSGSPVCAPARSVLMTGRHTGRTTVRGNGSSVRGPNGVKCSGGGGGFRVPLNDEDVTVAEVLRQAGYTTGITGKWGLGEPDTAGLPNRQGFDEWLGLLNQRRAHSYYPKYIWQNEQRRPLQGNSGTIKNFATEKHFVHDLFTEFALDFVRRHAAGNKPFFLYLPYTVPHSHFQIPELEPYAEQAEWPRQAQVYASMLTRVDRDMGRLLELLRELKIDERTLVFFCSDNGAADRYDGLFDSSGPLRGRKRDLYEGGIRVAMIARWPGTIAADTVSDDPWYFADVLPTLAELAGADPPEKIDGVSVAASLLGQPQPELQTRAMYWEFHERGFGQAARRGNWKAVRTRHEKPLELYDLAEDVGEKRNVAADHPEQVAWFERYFRDARTASPNWPSPLDDVR